MPDLRRVVVVRFDRGVPAVELHARAENRQKGQLSALRGHTEVRHKTDFVCKTPRNAKERLNAPRAARTVAGGGCSSGPSWHSDWKNPARSAL
jgi:hypothetical protein